MTLPLVLSLSERIENCETSSAEITIRVEDPDKAHTLGLNTDDSTLGVLCTKVAGYYSQLARLSFPRIEALVTTETGSFEVSGRPIAHTINVMKCLANAPRAVLSQPGTTYATAHEWLAALAEMKIAPLIF